MAVTTSSRPYQNIFGSGGSAPSYTPPSFTGQPVRPTTPSTVDRVMSILNSPAGAAGIQAVGAGAAAYGANKSAEAQRAQTAQQFAAEMAQRQLEGDRTAQQTAATNAAAASPLGADQMFAQRNALLGSLLAGSKNFSVTPGDPRIARAMGTVSGGSMLPPGGFDPGMIERLTGDKSTLASIAARQKSIGQINPRAASTDLSSMFGDQGAATSADVADANATELQRQTDQDAQQRALIQRAIDEDIRGQKPPDGYEYDKKTGELKKKGSVWKKLAKIGLIAGGGIATAMTAGAASPLLAAAIGAGVGAGTGAIDNGWKGALQGAALGGVTGGIIPGGAAGSVAKSAAKATLAGAAKQTMKNPAIYSAILGGR